MSNRLQPSHQAEALLYHARAATPFFSREGLPCASVPTSVDSCRILPLRSADFRDWLTANYYSEFESAPSPRAVRAAVRTLEARAQFGEAPVQKIDRRVSLQGDPFAPAKIFIDLANAAGEILEITPLGWKITDNLHHSFRQSASTLSLPHPEPRQTPAAGVLDDFARLFHLPPLSRTKILTWITAALRPTGPYPMLVLRGPACSGKSVLARALRQLIDPSTAPLRRLPASDINLMELALENWVLIFDPVYRVPMKLSEALCAIASGDAVEMAQPDARAAALMELARPIVLVAPVDESQAPWSPCRSLANRSLCVDLAPLAAPRPESAVWSEFEALRGPLLAAFADAVSCALRRLREVDVASVARLPDCAAWAIAAAPALHLAPEAISEAIADPDSVWMGSDPLRDSVYALLLTQPAWSGDASALLTELRARAPLAALPGDPRRLVQALARIPGISASRGKGDRGQRTLSIVRTGNSALAHCGVECAG